MTTLISAAGTYGPGTYKLAGNISGELIFTGPAKLDLGGFTVNRGGSGNAWDYGVIMQGTGSVIYNGAVTGARVGVKLEGAGSKIVGIDLSQNRYMGAWLAAASCEVIGGKCGNIGGVTDEKYAIGIQCDASAPVVRGVRFDEMYPQTGYVGSGAGEGLPVNFAATSVGGLMEACVAINSQAVVNTYGCFAGSGGSHKIRNNIFRNFWRGVTHASAGTPEITGNLFTTDKHIAGAAAASCEVSGCFGNIAVGYERPYSDGKARDNLSIIYPSSLTLTQPEGQAWKIGQAGTNIQYTPDALGIQQATGNGGGSAIAAVGKSSGKWYFEITYTEPFSFTGSFAGVTRGTFAKITNLTDTRNVDYWYDSEGRLNTNGSPAESTSKPAWNGAGHTVGVALDIDAGMLNFIDRNGSAVTGFSGLPAGNYFPIAGIMSGAANANKLRANFEGPFVHPVPSGFAPFV